MPDPSWPPVPHGWRLWVDDRYRSRWSARGAALNWAVGAAALVFVGSFMPFITGPLQGLHAHEFEPTATKISAVFGLVLANLAVGMRIREKTLSVLSTVGLLGVAALGALGYGGFAYAGKHGFDVNNDVGRMVHVEYSPNVGLMACFAGCVIATLAAISALRAAAND